MKPYGMKRTARPGCLCALCRNRGHKKGRGMDEPRNVCKSHARRQAQHEIHEASQQQVDE